MLNVTEMALKTLLCLLLKVVVEFAVTRVLTAFSVSSLDQLSNVASADCWPNHLNFQWAGTSTVTDGQEVLDPTPVTATTCLVLQVAQYVFVRLFNGTTVSLRHLMAAKHLHAWSWCLIQICWFIYACSAFSWQYHFLADALTPVHWHFILLSQLMRLLKPAVLTQYVYSMSKWQSNCSWQIGGLVSWGNSCWLFTFAMLSAWWTWWYY